MKVQDNNESEEGDYLDSSSPTEFGEDNNSDVTGPDEERDAVEEVIRKSRKYHVKREGRGNRELQLN